MYIDVADCDSHEDNTMRVMYMYSLVPCMWTLVWINIPTVSTLSGHVCSRQVAEQYLTSYSKAFVCPERYTTSCGHLDWRRCTKYRVQTCFSPGERYATRYRTVEDCCPGWTDAGVGSCTAPVCVGGCLNGGVCGDLGGMTGCRCQDGYTGEQCADGGHDVDPWSAAVVCLVCLLAVLVVAAFVLLYRRLRSLGLSSNESVVAGTARVVAGARARRRGYRPLTWDAGIELTGIEPSAPTDE